MYQYTIYTKGRYNNFAEGAEYSEADPGRTVSELVVSIWFSGVNRVFDSTRTGCDEPNPVGFSVSTKELAVHVGTCSYVVSRPSRTSDEPARPNLQIILKHFQSPLYW
ncbi:hypothetical protein AVEN_114532-1 [Araneus ventricosus]|uniref:Uncharacterized protein n=1 Tax=Araneus ventricosus TaxID=182803 RepID=A0A4Y2F4D6_ARAVE|nr:hypothetical protein AVEN_114532-1 [Araneus ventricosus]